MKMPSPGSHHLEITATASSQATTPVSCPPLFLRGTFKVLPQGMEGEGLETADVTAWYGGKDHGNHLRYTFTGSSGALE